MNLLREYVDAAESITAEEYWPYPSYGDLLFESSKTEYINRSSAVFFRNAADIFFILLTEK